MSKTIVTNLMVACVFVWAVSIQSTARAQTASLDAIYTEQQAARGKTVYTQICTECHGDDMTGVEDLIPPLTGKVWLKSWTGKTLGDLYDQIGNTMPSLAPGTLKPDQVVDLIAYMLSVGKYPAGSTELAPKADELKQIKIAPPRP